MNTLTWPEAYDKIIEAYFKDEIKPWDAKFCFCGNLNDKAMLWGHRVHDTNGYYTMSEYRSMEDALLTTDVARFEPDDVEYEDALFAGMSAALDILKEIHRSRGENVDELPALTKRVLSTQGK